MGGTGKGQEDSLVTGMLEKKFGFKVTYVPFKGGGTVAKNLIGKHIDSTVNNPSEQAGFWEAGKSRPLASFTPKGKLKAGSAKSRPSRNSVTVPTWSITCSAASSDRPA